MSQETDSASPEINDRGHFSPGCRTVVEMQKWQRGMAETHTVVVRNGYSGCSNTLEVPREFTKGMQKE